MKLNEGKQPIERPAAEQAERLASGTLESYVRGSEHPRDRLKRLAREALKRVPRPVNTTTDHKATARTKAK